MVNAFIPPPFLREVILPGPKIIFKVYPVREFLPFNGGFILKCPLDIELNIVIIK
jgi:hypothetical protein